MNKFIKYPIAAGLALALILGAAYALLGNHASVAFADVKEQFQHAKTLQMTLTTETQMNGKPFTMQMKIMSREPGLMRMETATPNGSASIAITDVTAKKMLVLDSAKKTAMVINLDALPTPGKADSLSQDWLAGLRKQLNLNGVETPLGQQVVEGKEATGFRVANKDSDLEIWVDKATGKPLLIKMGIHMPGLPAATSTMRDIILDGELPDSLFSLALPEGYTMQQLAWNMTEPNENDLAAGMKMLAQHAGGVFLDSLTPSPEEIRKLAKKFPDSKPADDKKDSAQQMAEAQPVMRMVMFAMQQGQKGNDFHYAAKGVKLGDADTPVAWWKGKDKGMYRVLYGDLTFKDLPAEKLPATAPAATASCPASQPASVE